MDLDTEDSRSQIGESSSLEGTVGIWGVGGNGGTVEQRRGEEKRCGGAGPARWMEVEQLPPYKSWPITVRLETLPPIF